MFYNSGSKEKQSKNCGELGCCSTREQISAGGLDMAGND